MVKVNRTFPAPSSLVVEREKVDGSYAKPDVVAQLSNDFHHKCYLCNHGNLMDIQVEHLRPHHHGKYLDLKFDWENLFLSCAHCNGMKNKKKYDGKIIDCCKVDPEQYLAFFCVASNVWIESKMAEDETACMSAMLLTEIFNETNTGARTYATEMRVMHLQKEMNVLYTYLKKYQEKPSARTVLTLKGLLKRESAYAAFKRAYVRTHAEQYPDLQELVALDAS